jgi:hypothetical protein
MQAANGTTMRLTVRLYVQSPLPLMIKFSYTDDAGG